MKEGNTGAVYIVGPELRPRYGVPDRRNPTIDAKLPIRNGCQWTNVTNSPKCIYSGNHTADLIAWGADHPKFPVHYHPHGALYVGISGRMCYDGDYIGQTSKVDPGEVRWVRPGFYYGPEYTCAGADGQNIGAVVLALHPNRGGLGVGEGGDNGAVSYDPPPNPYALQYPLVVSMVYESGDTGLRIEV